MATDDPGPTRRRRRPWLLAGGAALAVALVAGLVAFEPWALVVDDVVDEAPPTAAAGPAPSSGTPSPTSTAAATSGATTSAAPGASGPTVVAEGRLISHEHTTTGSVQVLQLDDGSRVLRLQDLDTSNGPDLKVWITDAPVREGREGWFVFDDGEYVDLGDLRGNRGSQNYPLPADVDLDRLSSVSIWCARFRVSFGAAELQPIAT